MQELPLAIAVIAALAVPSLAAADAAADIEASNQAFVSAFNGGDAAGVAARFTADAELMPPDMARVDGHDAIQALWQAFVDAKASGLDITTDTLDVLGEEAIETGSYQVTAPDPDGNPSTEIGKYLVVWKQEGGAWKMYRDIWNADPMAED